MSRRDSRNIVWLLISFAAANLCLLHWWLAGAVDSPVSLFDDRLGFFYATMTSEPRNAKKRIKKNKDSSSGLDQYGNFETKNHGLINSPVSSLDDKETVRKGSDVLRTSVESKNYNPIEYQPRLEEALKPISGTNASTAWIFIKPWAGLCNQYMMFLGSILVAIKEGQSQIIEESIQWKDTYGHETYVPHKRLFDVVHWNTFYPQLPRIIRHDRQVHVDIKVRGVQETIEGRQYSKGSFIESNVTKGDPFQVAKNPMPLGQNMRQFLNQYKMLSKKLDEEKYNSLSPATTTKEDSSFTLQQAKSAFEIILKSALRPRPEIQEMIDRFMQDMKMQPIRGGEQQQQQYKDRFMVIHARIEPDMQNHPMCKDKKVGNMTDIIEMIYKQYPEPPVSWVLLVFNRELVEAIVTGEITPVMDANKELKESFQNEAIQELTVHNLQVMNEIVKNGLWNGRVRVREAGSNYVKKTMQDPWYKHYSNIIGGIFNFFLAVQSDIFIGTEVSSYSTLVVNSRFYRGARNNYFYRPNGLYWVTPLNATKPHRFVC